MPHITGNGLKDRKMSSRGRKWKGRLNFPAQGGGAMAGIFTYVTGNWELLGNGLKDRKISPRGRKWKGRFPLLREEELWLEYLPTLQETWNYWEMD